MNNMDNEAIATLMSMGFDIDSIKTALEISNNDINIATQYLIEDQPQQTVCLFHLLSFYMQSMHF